MAFSAAQIQVAASLKELDCPEPVKLMLLTSLPNAFGPNLHQYQKELATMMHVSLETARAAAAQTQDSLSQKVKEDEAAMLALQAEADRSKCDEDSARAVLAEKTAELEKAKAAVAAEDVICETAVAAKELVATERQTLEAAKAEVESVKNGSFQMLLEGGWEDEEVRDACIEAVCNYLQEEDADAVLLAALPKALAVQPAQRGLFDGVTVEEANSVISAKISSLADRLAAGEENFEDATAEHLGAWAVFDVARDHEKAITAARDSADAALHAASEAQKLAVSKVIDQEASLANKLAEATLLESKVQQLERALTALTALESGELVDKEVIMEVDSDNKENTIVFDKENKENAMVVDKENNGNVMAVDMEISKESAMLVEQSSVAVS